MLIASLETAISKNHETVIVFASKDTPHTLGTLTHGIKSQEFILSDLKVIIEIQESCFEASAEGILIGDTKHHDTSPVVTGKVHSL